MSTVFENIRGMWERFDGVNDVDVNPRRLLPQVLGYLTLWPLNRRTAPYYRHLLNTAQDGDPADSTT